jgi:hypothetical protein
VVAEKFEAMVKLGMANSRMKDFYDIWALSREFDFDGTNLSTAIQVTFKRRNTALLTTLPLALTADFGESRAKQTQWNAFVRRTKLESVADALGSVVTDIRRFLEAPVSAASRGERLNAVWENGGPWR